MILAGRKRSNHDHCPGLGWPWLDSGRTPDTAGHDPDPPPGLPRRERLDLLPHARTKFLNLDLSDSLVSLVCPRMSENVQEGAIVLAEAANH